MRESHTLRRLRWIVLAGLAMSALTACTVSVSGGLLGALASMGVFALVALLVGGTQTGCIEAPTPDDAEVDDVDVGTSARDMNFAPCLSTDFGQRDDLSIGPCLGAPLPDLGPDLGLDLGPPDAGPPDMGPDQGALDMRIDDAGLPDLEIGPCLDPPPEPDQPPGKAMAPGLIDRAALFAKVTAGLPADVAARLVRPDDEV